MPLDERLTWLLIGCAIGFIVGYLVRAVQALREIKEELDHVDDCVKKCLQDRGDVEETRDKDDRGAAPPYFGQVALALVVLLTAYAAFSAQQSANDSAANQQQIERVAVCTQATLSNTVNALNERTTYTVAQAEANIELQRSQTEFLAVVVTEPEPSDAIQRSALKAYFEKLSSFVELSTATVNKIENNPFPTTEELSDCLETTD